ncbi:MAG: hypothetical protein CVU18_19175 [Betaproteobacteria bacterium HGW-Betaproteobacteria-12]|nr:MAG: hypothetical protein CVU18_19175 [Betaproteobacteria bacterium HGW-Betaproteobacteria-12]
MDRDVLQHHPDRAKLALLAAAGHLQSNNPGEARRLIRLAQDWGISNKLAVQILVAGVHNSLGRAVAIEGNHLRAFKHFENAILVGTPGSDTRLIAQARSSYQSNLLGMQAIPRKDSVGATVLADEKPESAVAYQVSLSFSFNKATPIKLGFNTKQNQWLRFVEAGIEFETVNGAPLYLVSNESGEFDKPPHKPQFVVQADTTYLVSGEIKNDGDNRPVVWIFQYAEGKQIDKQSVTVESSRFSFRFRSLPATESVAIGIRLAGHGKLLVKGSSISLHEQTNDDVAAFFVEQLKKAEQAQKRDMENSMKQIEACIRLQHYLGPEIILPDTHNWPISPDFGVLLVNLVEQNEYDAVIEFGSGTSTLILAKALDRVGRREQRKPSPLLSFDHLQEYRDKTQKSLKQAGLTEYADVVIAELQTWKDADGTEYAYYDCDPALRALKQQLEKPNARILVVVDGPPAALGRHARYPALSKVLGAVSSEAAYDFLMDDYLRTDEQEIIARWSEFLTQSAIPHERIEFKNLEKKACLLSLTKQTITE